MIKAGVVVFPGSNCDVDTYYVLKKIGFDVHFHFHNQKDIFKYKLLVLPGGFSYGDYLRAGAIAKFSAVMESIYDFIDKELGLVLGICNGFQILTEAGILEGALTRNLNGRFICKIVELEVVNNDTPFTRLFEKQQIIRIPIAHSEGRYIHAQPEELFYRNLVVFKYLQNPNGSDYSIAGIINAKWNVLGMMPHPERRSEGILGEGSSDGDLIFRSILRFL
jgi:phosphoribosylformylglycinamidine synthase I